MDAFDRMYEGTPPWEIGKPQPAFVDAAEAIRGRVLDLGCGTGELALFFAARGCSVLGVDAARAAIASAMRKASARDLKPELLVHDALSVSVFGRTFDAVLDSGFFHTLTDDGRAHYREELAQVMTPGATLYLLCFSDKEPDWGGPRRVSEAELREAFPRPFFVESVVPARFETRDGDGAAALFARIVHIGMPRATLS